MLYEFLVQEILAQGSNTFWHWLYIAQQVLTMTAVPFKQTREPRPGYVTTNTSAEEIDRLLEDAEGTGLQV